MPSRPPRKISNLCFDFISKSESCGKFALFARIISIWYDFPSSLSFPCATTQKQRFFHETRYSWRKIFPRLGNDIYIYIYTFDFWTIAFQFTMVERIDAVFRRRVVDRGTKNAWTRGKRAREKEREKRGEGSEGEITPYITKVEFKFLRFRPGTND